METKISRFSKISNTLFLTASVFCLFFLWCNFYTKRLKLSTLCSIIVAICFLIIYLLISKIRNKYKYKNLEKVNSIEKFKINLMYSQTECFVNIMKSIIQFNTKKQVSQNHYLLDNKKDLFTFLQENISPVDIQNIYQSRKTNDVCIVSISKFDLPFEIKNLNMEIYDLEKLYQYCQENNINTLQNVNSIKKPKYSIKDIFCIVLNKQKSKSYFWLGVVLLFSSLFTPFSSYYIIVSTILFLLSLFSRFNKIFNKK